MPRVKVTLSIDEKVWMDFRIKCLRQKKIASDVVEKFMRDL